MMMTQAVGRQRMGALWRQARVPRSLCGPRQSRRERARARLIWPAARARRQEVGGSGQGCVIVKGRAGRDEWVVGGVEGQKGAIKGRGSEAACRL